MIVDRLPRRIHHWKKAPLTSGLAQVKQRVYDVSGRVLAKGLAGKEKSDTLPLGICQIGNVCHAFPGVVGLALRKTLTDAHGVTAGADLANGFLAAQLVQ